MPHKKSAAAERLHRERKRKPALAKKSGKVEARASAGHDKAKKGKPARPAAVAPAARVSRAKDPHADAAKLKSLQTAVEGAMAPATAGTEAKPVAQSTVASVVVPTPTKRSTFQRRDVAMGVMPPNEYEIEQALVVWA